MDENLFPRCKLKGSNSRRLGTPLNIISGGSAYQDIQIRSFTPTFKKVGFCKKTLLIESKQSIFEAESPKIFPKVFESFPNISSYLSQKPTPPKEKKCLSPIPPLKELRYFPARFKDHTKEKCFRNKDLKSFLPSAHSDLQLLKQINKNLIESHLNRVKAAKAYLGMEFSDDFLPCHHSQSALVSS